ncbi:YchJ family metal-binding protein, partial [Neisseria meningitidis]|uniref:YchJ family metal-binding protein n=1 Tax=Neisseria meningitidis TaxID=487 RepID=UPI0021A34E24
LKQPKTCVWVSAVGRERNFAKVSSYAGCCRPLHLRQILPPTAEALMRSRYSAYVLHLIDYSGLTKTSTALPRLAVLSVLSAA